MSLQETILFAFAYEIRYHETSYSDCCWKDFYETRYYAVPPKMSFHETSFLGFSRNQVSRKDYTWNEIQNFEHLR